MIVVKIFQGPGNQMFQYAYGLAVAKRLGVKLKLDTSWYKRNSDHRNYILDRFSIQTEIATEADVEYIRTLNGRNFFEYRFNILRNMLAPRHRKAMVIEDLSVFDESLMFPYDPSIIEGYFTTERFFKDAEEDVRRAFQFNHDLPENVSVIADSITENTVALSIRRGDFLGNELHNICSVQYFQRAVEKIKEFVSEPKLLIFSDDTDWVRANMNFGIEHKYVEQLQDSMNYMRLMSLCKNHIIPNSTFSWWGAWLSNPKNVVAPDLWLTDDKKVHKKVFGHWVETKHTVPNSWLRIPAALNQETMM